MKKHLVAAGYFGCGNIGDDAILMALRDSWPGELSALSGFPEDTQRNLGIRSYPRKDMKAVKLALESADALVFPGGSIFQDASSVRSVLYYSTLVKMAKKMGKKVAMIGQGVGPVTSSFGKRWTRQAFEAADGIAVRDAASQRLLNELGIRKPIRVASDMAFLLTPPPTTDDEKGFGVGGMKSIGLAPRPLKKGDSVAELFGEITRTLFQAGYMPVLIEMDSELDRTILDAIDKANGGKVPSIRKVGHPNDLMKRLRRMEALISVRLHTGILGSIVGVPTVMLDYDPKVTAFAQEADLPHLPMNQLNASRVLDSLNTMLKNREKTVEKLSQRTETLRKNAVTNLDVLEAVVGR